MAAKTGVYPVFENKFKIGASAESLNTIAEMENFSVSIDGNVEEWSPMEQEGWLKRMVTGKALTISLSGKRCIGDPGNDFVEASAWGTGSDCEAHFVPFPVSWTVKMKKKQKETQDILSYHSQAAGCSDKARAKASGGRQPIEECGRTGL